VVNYKTKLSRNFKVGFGGIFTTFPHMGDTESVRISKELKQQLKQLAQSMRPRTAVQYLIEDAIEQYLGRVAEEKGPAYQVKPGSKSKKA
jgi:hydrogenase maturation factor HypF (carbamoyltransferase family)